MKLGFTGTREGMTDAQKQSVYNLLRDLWPLEVHHGDCVGADMEFNDIASDLRVKYERPMFGKATPARRVIHPPIEKVLRAGCIGHEYRKPKDYLIRNRDIVDETGALIACPKTAQEQRRSGTWSTVRYARTLNRRVYIVMPDGTVEIER